LVSTDENGQYSSLWMQTEAGDYQIRASWPGDATTLPAESPVLNVTVTIRDIALIDLDLQEIKATIGDLVTIKVIALNKGTATETFHITVYHGNTTIVKAAAAPLPAGRNGTISIPWDTTGLAEGIYTLEATAEPLPGETFEVDNSIATELFLQEPSASSSDIFLYTTTGLAVLVAAMAVYILLSRGSKPR
jgi:hypothetical protein